MVYTVADMESVFVSKIELDRSGKSFTVDTLRQLVSKAQMIPII